MSADLRRYVSGQFPEVSEVQVQPDTNTNQAVIALFAAVNSLIRRLNLGLSLGTGETLTAAGNLDAVYIEVTTPVKPNEEFVLHHGLGRIPIGYDVVRKDMAADVYDSSPGSWSNKTIRLACNTASATLTLRVY